MNVYYVLSVCICQYFIAASVSDACESCETSFPHHCSSRLGSLYFNYLLVLWMGESKHQFVLHLMACIIEGQK